MRLKRRRNRRSSRLERKLPEMRAPGSYEATLVLTMDSDSALSVEGACTKVVADGVLEAVEGSATQYRLMEKERRCCQKG
ncbi:MAG: hypothetical protein LUC98_02175 [Lachnospiraceae bacterium]|nr:hypothetical protein [Lachnospiraceae bacterium]